MMTPTAEALVAAQHASAVGVPPRLWVYTNFDCNLSCSYCLSSSSPSAPRRAIPFTDYCQLLDEARYAGITEVFLTGGEPFLLPDIFERIEYAGRTGSVTVLTNGLLLRGARLQRLEAFAQTDLTLQVSLDGHLAELHDAYRGKGTWKATVAAIRRLLNAGFHITIGATETPVNSGYEGELRDFVAGLGIPEADFLFRPLTRNGFATEGLDLSPEQIVPELTVTLDGVFWHPQSGGAAHQLSHSIQPLQPAIDLLHATYQRLLAGGPTPQVYRCA
jgi:MoaA/NifB/PqqE/SkfB family radical SAM enzyme